MATSDGGATRPRLVDMMSHMQLYAKKSLGQHFLNSRHVLEQIIAAAELAKGDNVLEIGPGTGILTEALLETGANVLAIEKDERAIGLLQTKFEVASHSGRLKVIEGDILNAQCPTPNAQFSVVANIPYYITGAILEKFLEHEPRPTQMVLLVQKEVAERIIASDGKESILSISVKAFGTPRLIAKVPRGAFTPAPTVDSAILSISNISNGRFTGNNVDIKWFFALVRAGFAHKRKFLIRNIEEIADQGDIAVQNDAVPNISAEKLREVWENLGFDPKIRAEDLNIDKWLLLAAKLAQS